MWTSMHGHVPLGLTLEPSGLRCRDATSLYRADSLRSAWV